LENKKNTKQVIKFLKALNAFIVSTKINGP